MSHIVDACPLTKLNDGLSQRHSADDEAVAWLMHTQEKEVLKVALEQELRVRIRVRFRVSA